MIIYTGYFYKLNEYLDAGLIPISIAGRCPDYYTGLQYRKLAPKYSFFIAYKNKYITSDQYKDRYNEEILNKLDKKEVLKDLHDLVGDASKNSDIILLCYEKPGDFCHRRLVAKWLSDLYTIQEFEGLATEDEVAKTKNFEHASSIGLIGENIFIKYINQNLEEGLISKDVRLEKEYQNKDIDFVIQDTVGNTVKTFEVKTETTLNNKISVVYWKDLNKQKKGWIQVTEADIIFLYKQQLNRAFLIKTDILKKYIEQLPLKDLEVLYAKSPRQAWGYVINLTDLQKNNALLKIINF